MSDVEQLAKKPSSATGFFAALSAFFGGQGIGARLRRHVLSALVALAGVLGGLAFGVSPALAFQTRVAEGGFGPDGTAATEFLHPWSLAVDQSTSQLYVASLEGVVRRFSASHTPESLPNVGFALDPVSEQGDQLAVNSTTHDFYVVGHEGFVPPPLRAFQANGAPADFTAGPGAGTNEIAGSQVCGVAVDSSGDVYVSEFSGGVGVRVFAEDGELITTIPSFGTCNLAVDSHGNVYVAQPGGPVEEFVASAPPPVTSSTGYLSAGVIDPNASFTVAVDPADDDLLVDEGSQVAEYDEAGTRLGSFGVFPAGTGKTLSGSEGVAVDNASGQVYVSNSEGGPHQVEIFGSPILLPDVTTAAASEIKPKGTAVLNGAVNPDGVALTECRFEYVEAQEYQAGTKNPYEQGATAACVPAAGAIPTGEETQVHADVEGLRPGVGYHFRLVAGNHAGSNPGLDETFSTLPKPAISGESTANLTGEAVDLSANVNPGGVATTCVIEHGISTEYEHGKSDPCETGNTAEPGNVGAGTSAVPITGHLTGLHSNETYHWRVVATSEAGTTVGPDNTFIYDTSGERLPDNRAYEMVTPAHKNGALIGAVAAGESATISEAGSRLVLSSIQCFAGAESCTADRLTEGEQYLFSRELGGWVTTALAPPASQFEANSGWLVSAETGMELFSIPTPPMNEDDFYAREPDGSFKDIGPATPPSDGALGIVWGGGSLRATKDFSRVVFQETHVWPFDKSNGKSTYELAGTGNPAPVLVGVTGGTGSPELISKCGTELGAAEKGSNPGELSADGETVFFTVPACPEGGTGTNASVAVPVQEVFARVGESRTVAISEPSAFSAAAPYPGCSEEPCIKNVNDKANWGNAVFAGASNDGSKAFFTSGQQLTDNASTEGNLYEYHAGDCGGEGHLTDVSAGDSSGGGPRVQGVVATSTDGSHVYFVAKGVLTQKANEQGATAQAGANNLYVFSHEECQPGGQVTFVTALPEADNLQWSANNDESNANVTPDGRFLVFESTGDLTPDDTSASGATQIFRYDAQTGALVRISVGERGFDDNGNANSQNASIVRAFLGNASAEATRSDPTMSNDGSYVFFTSPVGLTPHALNELQVGFVPGEPEYAENVYEWHEGQVSLISDGRDTTSTGNQEKSVVTLIGSDGSGANVFFTTADALVPQDTDTQIDYYDARICEAADPCVSAPAPSSSCSGEVCHGTPAGQPPVQVGPSATFNGPGNVGPQPAGKPVVKVLTRAQKLAAALRACHRKAKGKRRSACEKQARARYGPRKTRAKKTNRRVSR
jgi:hypothetical protein